MLLFIAQEYNSFFGGGVITHRNLMMCREALGEENVSTFILPPRKGGKQTLIEFATGNLMGLNSSLKKKLLNILEINDKIQYIFLDYSLHGKLAELIKLQFPKIKIFIFFHNVEVQYFILYLKTSKKFHHIIGYASILINEKKSVKYADHIITLNDRDSNYLSKHFGRKADLVLPTSISDTFDSKKLLPASISKKISLLFVGSRFFPNEQGLEWFIKNVIPHVPNAVLKIVGKGFEDLKINWESPQVEVVGFSNLLHHFYYEADIVIAPIFVGSGMKTKTAEALMYGKTILASTEAFEGYYFDKSAVGKECKNSSDYITFINTYQPMHKLKFNPASRNIFEKMYSYSIIMEKFKKFILT